MLFINYRLKSRISHNLNQEFCEMHFSLLGIKLKYFLNQRDKIKNNIVKKLVNFSQELVKAFKNQVSNEVNRSLSMIKN